MNRTNEELKKLRDDHEHWSKEEVRNGSLFFISVFLKDVDITSKRIRL